MNSRLVPLKPNHFFLIAGLFCLFYNTSGHAGLTLRLERIPNFSTTLTEITNGETYAGSDPRARAKLPAQFAPAQILALIPQAGSPIAVHGFMTGTQRRVFLRVLNYLNDQGFSIEMTLTGAPGESTPLADIPFPVELENLSIKISIPDLANLHPSTRTRITSVQEILGLHEGIIKSMLNSPEIPSRGYLEVEGGFDLYPQGPLRGLGSGMLRLLGGTDHGDPFEKGYLDVHETETGTIAKIMNTFMDTFAPGMLQEMQYRETINDLPGGWNVAFETALRHPETLDDTLAAYQEILEGKLKAEASTPETVSTPELRVIFYKHLEEFRKAIMDLYEDALEATPKNPSLLAKIKTFGGAFNSFFQSLSSPLGSEALTYGIRTFEDASWDACSPGFSSKRFDDPNTALIKTRAAAWKSSSHEPTIKEFRNGVNPWKHVPKTG